METKKIYLTLENGAVFEGYAFGAEGERVGEVVFSTSMVGYVEALSDPSNYGQILLQTFPLIGNYGVMPVDAESKKASAAAYVVREICEKPSNFRMEGGLDEYLKEQGVVGIYGVDTRQLTKLLRERGTMNAKISNQPLNAEEIASLSSYKLANAVQAVAPTQKQIFGDENAKYTVALWNFGAKNSTVQNLTKQGCKVISMPFTATAEEILSVGADGVVIADGPGNPAEYTTAVAEIKKIIGKTSIFGIGLGHELVALAFGAKTLKLHHGHRGANQPVKDLQSGRVYISTQNHGYEVDKDSIKQGKLRFVNVNDGTCEGIDYDEANAFTVQFTPEACDLGNVVNPLYAKFFAMMDKEKKNA